MSGIFGNRLSSRGTTLLPQHEQRTSSLSPIPLEASHAARVAPSHSLESTLHAQSPWLFLQRQATQLQRDLQTLLDAQSEGLVAGLGGAPPSEDASSNGSRTPTQSSIKSHERRGRVVPVRQPVKKKVGLRGARKGILRAMNDLSLVKADQEKLLEEEMAQREDAIRQADAFGAKRQGLKEEIQGIQRQEENQRIEVLQEESDAVQREIRELENQLYEKRTRQRHLEGEMQTLKNSVQAKLSSYQASVSMVDGQVQRFLARPPLVLHDQSRAKEIQSFYSLPPKRRTLEMAKEHWREEQSELRNQKNEMEVERDALRDGAILWQETVERVTSFEKDLREEVQRGASDAGMSSILTQMGTTVTALRQSLEQAEQNNWRLLQCCIGAELEAFEEGRAILQEAAGTVEAIGEEPQQREDVERGDSRSSDVDDVPPDDLLGTHEEPVGEGEVNNDGPSPALPPRVRSGSTDEENDEPDPDLLVSHFE